MMPRVDIYYLILYLVHVIPQTNTTEKLYVFYMLTRIEKAPGPSPSFIAF